MESAPLDPRRQGVLQTGLMLGLVAALAGCKLTFPERDDDGDVDLALLMPPEQYQGVARVQLRIEAVELERRDGEISRIDVDPPQRVALLPEQDQDPDDPQPNAVFIGKSVRSGEYRRLSLIVDGDDRLVRTHTGEEFTGDAFELSGDGDDQLDLESDFRIEGPEDEELILSLNLHAGLERRQDGFALGSAHVITTTATSGEVRFLGIPSESCANPLDAGVYLYDGLDQEPTELGSNDDSAPFFGLWSGNRTSFILRYVPAGEYTVAWTCNAGEDEPGETNDIDFEDQRNLEVQEERCSALALDGGNDGPGEPGSC